MGIKINKTGKKVAGVTETATTGTKTAEAPVGKISKDSDKPSYATLMKEAKEKKVAKPSLVEEADAMDEELKEVEMTEEEADAVVDAVMANKETSSDVLKKYTGKEAIGTVSKTFNDGSVVDETEVVKEAVLMDQPPANVGVSCGVTRNIGNYESLKFQVTINIPCVADAQDIEDTYEQAKNWVDGKIDEINAEVNSSLGE